MEKWEVLIVYFSTDDEVQKVPELITRGKIIVRN